MLGLERVLTEDPARTAAGTELRRHQVDALAGMLAELIASTQRAADENGNGNGHRRERRERAEVELDEERRRRLRRRLRRGRRSSSRSSRAPDPGAVRRYRFRHPTASGKTIAAAGFVEAARAPRRPHPDPPPAPRLAVQSRPHDRGLRRAASPMRILAGIEAAGRRTRSRSRRTHGSHGTARSSTARRTTSSSATRRTRLSARRRAPRSARSPSRSSSG